MRTRARSSATIAREAQQGDPFLIFPNSIFVTIIAYYSSIPKFWGSLFSVEYKRTSSGWKKDSDSSRKVMRGRGRKTTNLVLAALLSKCSNYLRRGRDAGNSCFSYLSNKPSRMRGIWNFANSFENSTRRRVTISPPIRANKKKLSICASG